MKLKIAITLLLAWAALVSPAFAEEKSMMVRIITPAEDFFDNSSEGSDPLISGDGKLLVTGLVNHAGFLIKNINNMAVLDSDGNNIPLLVDSSSLYSEFDDDEINSVKVGFLLDSSKEKDASLRFVWGEDVKAENKKVASFVVYGDQKDLYRKFVLEAPKGAGNSSDYTATLEIIVDDYADTYYLWYLLPMVLIFVLLFIRKAAKA